MYFSVFIFLSVCNIFSLSSRNDLKDKCVCVTFAFSIVSAFCLNFFVAFKTK